MFPPSRRRATVLYASCAYCGFIQPLFCAGQFMPHMPLYVSATPMGAACPQCGPLPPVFMCRCGFRQYLYLAGSSPAPQQGYSYAVVVQAPQGASQQSLSKAVGDVVGKAATGLGRGAVEAMFGQGG
jgi:hypothetical protein